jgi:simple sugar transport system permease protein
MIAQTDSGSASWLFALMLATLYSATPLVLAALGGVLSERAGVVNIALEGFILAGAFVGAWAGQSSPQMGLVGALTVGAFMGLLHAFFTQTLRMNHVISGLGITLLATGATRYLSLRWFAEGFRIEGLPPLLFLALAAGLPFVVLFVLNKTRFGLRLRAVGENPESARMAGIAPGPPRFAAVTLSGVLAAMAGAYLSMAEAHTFSSNMSAGKGYIALAAVIFGKWHPLGAALGALFFGFFYAVQTQLQISGHELNWLGVEWTSPFLLDSLPYLMTLAALVSVVGRAVPPAALGKEDE